MDDLDEPDALENRDEPDADQDALEGELPAPLEQVQEQTIIAFEGDPLITALTTAGNIYLSLPGLCRAFGLNAQAQLRRCQRSDVLARGLRQIRLETPQRGEQLTYCLRVDKLGLWAAGLETKRMKVEFQGKIIAYQEELAPLATRVFLRAVAGPAVLAPANDPRLAELAAEHDTLLDIAAMLRDHMAAIQAGQSAIVTRLDQTVQVLEGLAHEVHTLDSRQGATEGLVERIDERTAHLTPAHKRQVQTFVDQMVRATKALPTPLSYAIIYGRIKQRYSVGSYAEVPDDAFDGLLAYLRDQLHRATSGEAPEQGQLF